jgi:hypothetical protein
MIRFETEEQKAFVLEACRRAPIQGAHAKKVAEIIEAVEAAEVERPNDG